MVKSLQGTYVTKIACGLNHSAAIGRFEDDFNDEIDNVEFLQRGRLYSWGCSDHGKLGLGRMQSHNQDLPRAVSFPEGYGQIKCVDVSLGDEHSLLLVETVSNATMKKERFLFASGRGMEGQLGNGSTLNSWDFRIVPDVEQESRRYGVFNVRDSNKQERKSAVAITGISAGGNCSMALLANNQLKVWGQNFGLEGCLKARDVKSSKLLRPVDIKSLDILRNKNIRGIEAGSDHCLIFGSSFVIAV